MSRRILAVTLAAVLAFGTAGCTSVKQTTKTMVEQGVETTSTGPHNVVPANSAENAVNAINGQTQQTQDAQPGDTGQ